MDTPTQRADPPFGLTGVFQAGRFLAVGASNTVVDAGLYVLLSGGLFPPLLPKLVAKSVSYLAGVVNSYFWNRRWTFRSSSPASRSFLPFLLVNLAGMGLNVALLHAALDLLRLQEAPAVAIATGGVIVWNFGLNKYVVFKKIHKGENQ